MIAQTAVGGVGAAAAVKQKRCVAVNDNWLRVGCRTVLRFRDDERAVA
jgi:hypothetical protein